MLGKSWYFEKVTVIGNVPFDRSNGIIQSVECTPDRILTKVQWIYISLQILLRIGTPMILQHTHIHNMDT